MIELFYNGVVLRDCEIQSFDQTIIRDLSNTDNLYSRFVVTVASTLHHGLNAPLNSIDPGPDSEGAIVYQTVLRHHQLELKLKRARQDFWLVVGGQSDDADTAPSRDLSILVAAGNIDDGPFPDHPSFPGATTVPRLYVIDCENGPHPVNIQVEQIYGGRALRVIATFKICRLICDTYFESGEPPPNPTITKPSQWILNNRWELTENKGSDWNTQRILSGTLRTIHADIFAQNYRALCIPPLLRGYKRADQSFASDATNTILKYRITDIQEHASPPPPAIRWEGVHTETLTKQGANQVAEINVTLIGPPGVNKADLIAACGKVITSRIYGPVRKTPGSHQSLLRHLSITDYFGEPKITMRANISYHIKDQTTNPLWFTMRVAQMAMELNDTLGIDGYHPLIHPVPLVYDSTTPTGIFACYLQDPCSIWHSIGGQVPESKANERPVVQSTGSRPDGRDYPAQILEPTKNESNQYQNDERYDIFKFPYTYYDMSTEYEISNGKMHLPYAGTPEPGEPSSTVLQVHNGISRRHVLIDAVRLEKLPVIPEFNETQTDINGITETLYDVQITTYPPKLTAGNELRENRLSIQMSYFLNRVLTRTEKLRAGAEPTDSIAPQTIPLGTIFDVQGKIDK